MSEILGKVIDRYVIIEALSCDNTTKASAKVTSTDANTHASRITLEHTYASMPQHSMPLARKRRLPPWLVATEDEPVTSPAVHKAAPDGVFNYASAVLNDGLLMFELRDAIHEGDGE